MQRMKLRCIGAVMAALAVVVGGCGSSGGGGGAGAEALDISGAVLAPPGAVTQLTQIAQTGGQINQVEAELTPVPGATVELIEVNGLGEQIGDVLATSLTSTTGHYSLVLPTGLSLSAKLMVRVTANSETVLRGLVVSENVDITPVSEYIARKLTSDGNTLDNVSPNEVLTITAHLEQFDFFVAPTIEETIANLDDVAGPSLAPLLELAQQPAGDASALEGDYYFTNFGLVMNTFQITNSFADSGTLTLVDDGDGAGTLTDIDASESEAVQTAQGNGSGGVNYGLITTFDLDFEADGPPFQVSADGSLTILEPFEEEIFAEGEPGFPGGLRIPATATTLHPVANGFYAGLGYFAETIYDVTPAGTAIDLDSPRGKDTSFELVFAIKKGPIANSVIDGKTYGVVSFAEFVESHGPRELFSDVGTMEFTSTGATKGTADGDFDPLSLNRTPTENSLNANVFWGNTGAGGVDDPVPESDSTVIPYTLDPDTGAVTMMAGSPEPEQACFASGGRFFVLTLDLDEGDPIDGACRGILMGIRLGSSNPSLANKTYKMLVIEKGIETNGSSTISRLLGATLAITGAGTLTVEGTASELSRGNDLDTTIESDSETFSVDGTFSFGGNNGRISVEVDGTMLEGWMNASGSMGTLRLYNSNIEADGEASLGMVVLIEQN